jgi:hypothetical protein
LRITLVHDATLRLTADMMRRDIGASAHIVIQAKSLS